MDSTLPHLKDSRERLLDSRGELIALRETNAP